MELDGYEPDVELTIDLIEAPYLFIYTTDEDAWNMKVFMRGYRRYVRRVRGMGKAEAERTRDGGRAFQNH